jgi:hypothetical protein
MRLSFIAPVVAAFALLIVATPATAQNTALAGTYKLVEVDNVSPDGTHVHLYGDNPHGLLTLDSSGRYSIQIYRSGRPKFAAKDKSKGTPEEYQAAVQGCNTHFGQYSVDEPNHTITFRVEHASFPNWEGASQKRTYTVDGSKFTYVVDTPTSGGGNVKGEVIWQRLPQ